MFSDDLLCTLVCVFVLVCSVCSIASLWLSTLLCWSTECELILFLISRLLHSQEHAVEIYPAPDAVCLATAVLMLCGICEHKGRKSFLSHLCVMLLCPVAWLSQRLKEMKPFLRWWPHLDTHCYTSSVMLPTILQDSTSFIREYGYTVTML